MLPIKAIWRQLTRKARGLTIAAPDLPWGLRINDTGPSSYVATVPQTKLYFLKKGPVGVLIRGPLRTSYASEGSPNSLRFATEQQGASVMDLMFLCRLLGEAAKCREQYRRLQNITHFFF
ncbi:hypothetical protein TNCV_91421 [Trichonephila clavipes]|nr:hypothetical protein TNCV_91421 [Trichonephila clavipes]